MNDVSLNLRDNEFVAILGPSGSGKTTLLNIIGGLDKYDRGDLIINGISTKKYKDKDWDSYRNHTIGFVFQSYNLIPHQTVLSNVELALTISGISKAERRQRAFEALSQVGLKGQEHKRPNQMSGGQMQRVAIARALVNNPDILLADEPTGALDTETSVQIMDLLKEVAKDRLVVMVTHNPELAIKYATRIVNLKDGDITDDSNPYVVENVHETRHENMGKSSMSFFTSLALSFNNLKTKKARTFLTSFAGSIGIIGIALILSLSNGVNNYIKATEENTLTQYPLQISSSGFDISGFLGAPQNETNKVEQESDEIYVSTMLTSLFSKINANDLTSLKTYIDSGNNDIKANSNAIEYVYNIEPQLFSAKGDKAIQVHPEQAFNTLGMGSTSMASPMGDMSMNSFYELPSSAKLYQDQYDVKSGRWPQSYDESVLVLSESGKITDMMLYTLGLRDHSELETMVDKFSKEEDIIVPEVKTSYTYDDILKTEFKLVDNYQLYQYDEKYNVYIDKSDDANYMKELVDNASPVKIVGIVQPTPSSKNTMLRPGIGYTPELTTHVIENAASSDIVKKQLEKPTINVFTGKEFTSKEESGFDMQSLISIDENMLSQAFSIDESKLAMPDLDLSNIKIDTDSLTKIDMLSILSNIQVDITEKQIEDIAKVIQDGFTQYLKDNGILIPSADDFNNFIQSEKGQALIQSQVGSLIDQTTMVEQFQTQLQSQMNVIMNEVTASLSTQLETELTKQLGGVASSFQNAFHVDTDKIASAFQVNMDEKEMAELMRSLMTKEMSSLDGNLKKLGYADFSKPTTINIYPKDFESKKLVINDLDHYNETMSTTDESKVIAYTDYVGALMSSVTSIINVISYVLVAFVAISLVVSSIMIGVITYISVLERKKEIGILRAIGASKRNISSVFNAETFIVGLISGLLGIGITLLLLIPANIIIYNLSGDPTLAASLPINGAIILILLSVVLTLLGGLIPSKKAAQEDPVTALRTD